MDTIDQKIAEFWQLQPGADGECWGKAAIVEELQRSIGDRRVLGFFLRLIADHSEHDMARVEVLKSLELNPPLPPEDRLRVARQIAMTFRGERDQVVRQWLGIALAGYVDLPAAFEAAAARVRDPAEDEDVRFNCLAALERLGPTREVVSFFRDLGAGSDSVAASAQRQLSEWGVIPP
jgi:hypothetical protein